jgi:hypothetical protein
MSRILAAMNNNHVNPGTTNPADQAYPRAAEPQQPAGQASTAATTSDGELQLPSLQPVHAAHSDVRGLPSEINAGHASQVRSQSPKVAETRPPAKNVMADCHHPGGLPTNVNIR